MNDYDRELLQEMHTAVRDTTKRNLAEVTEMLVDRHTVGDVLLALELICAQKAEHLRHHWQDSITAKAWDRAGAICGRASLKVEV